MSSELKPCPWCSATDGVTELDEHQGYKWGAVLCSCGIFGPEVRTGYDTNADAPWRAEAIEAWNTRATQPPAVGVDVSEEMVERAMDAFAKEPANANDDDWDHACMRAALHAALRTGGGEDHG